MDDYVEYLSWCSNRRLSTKNPIGEHRRSWDEEELNRRLGDRLAELRREQKVTQAALEYCLEKTKGYISHCETAERRIGVAEFLRICFALDVDPRKVLRDVWQPRLRPTRYSSYTDRRGVAKRNAAEQHQSKDEQVE
jgi:transcriptional regulator with XRE-family HTH domain